MIIGNAQNMTVNRQRVPSASIGAAGVHLLDQTVSIGYPHLWRNTCTEGHITQLASPLYHACHSYSLLNTGRDTDFFLARKLNDSYDWEAIVRGLMAEL